MNKKKRCRICGKPLSHYNPADVCFCHPEHPDALLYPIRDLSRPPVGAGHSTYGVDYMDIQYNGICDGSGWDRLDSWRKWTDH